MFILSRKHFEAKQHWKPQKLKGTTQKIDFEWKTHWSQTKENGYFDQKALRSQTTLGIITSEGNHPKC